MMTDHDRRLVPDVDPLRQLSIRSRDMNDPPVALPAQCGELVRVWDEPSSHRIRGSTESSTESMSVRRPSVLRVRSGMETNERRRRRAASRQRASCSCYFIERAASGVCEGPSGSSIGPGRPAISQVSMGGPFVLACRRSPPSCQDRAHGACARGPSGEGQRPLAAPSAHDRHLPVRPVRCPPGSGSFVLKPWSRGWESNPQPSVYKTLAPRSMTPI